MLKYIIIPTYNEAENLTKLVEQIFSLNIAELNIIIVDDNSSDGTGKIADELSQKYPLRVIHRQAKQGLGSAYVSGFKAAIRLGADLVFEMDADFSHDPKDIPRLIEEIKNGYDLVIGSRRIRSGNVSGWSWIRNLESKSAMTFARAILGLKTKDITAGFRCYRTSILKQIDLDKIHAGSYAFQEEMIYLSERKGFKIKEIPVTFIDRKFGKSKLGVKDILEFFVTVLRLRFRK
jgi:dolichol-phosphate mannosyltransferase